MEHLIKVKLQERTRVIEKGQERKKKQLDKLDEIKLEPLVTSIEELNQRVTSITSLSIPKPVQDAEPKKLVQRQVQVRSMVFHQKGIKLNMTEKGKPRHVPELLQDLSKVIKERPVCIRRKEQTCPVHQELYTTFEKPSLLKGVKIKHRFDMGGFLEWYEGTIKSVRNNKFTIYYKESDETCQFTLDDIFSLEIFMLCRTS